MFTSNETIVLPLRSGQKRRSNLSGTTDAALRFQSSSSLRKSNLSEFKLEIQNFFVPINCSAIRR